MSSNPYLSLGIDSFPFNKCRELWYDCLAPEWEGNEVVVVCVCGFFYTEILSIAGEIVSIVSGPDEKLYTGTLEVSGLAAIALRLLSRIYQFSQRKLTHWSSSWPASPLHLPHWHFLLFSQVHTCGQNPGLGRLKTQFQILILPSISCVGLGKPLTFSVPLLNVVVDSLAVRPWFESWLSCDFGQVHFSAPALRYRV